MHLQVHRRQCSSVRKLCSPLGKKTRRTSQCSDLSSSRPVGKRYVHRQRTNNHSSNLYHRFATYGFECLNAMLLQATSQTIAAEVDCRCCQPKFGALSKSLKRFCIAIEGLRWCPVLLRSWKYLGESICESERHLHLPN